MNNNEVPIKEQGKRNLNIHIMKSQVKLMYDSLSWPSSPITETTGDNYTNFSHTNTHRNL